MVSKVLVASQNRVKAMAAHDALSLFGGGTYETDLSQTPIQSGVREQPLSLEETATGAINRLIQARKVGGYSYYVAIEGGIYSVDTPTGTMWYESACAAVSDDKTHTPSVAFGPAYPIPRNIIRHVHEGKDLNEAMEIETGIAEIGNSVGFNGWLTDGKLDRQAASAQAVLMALYGLEHERKTDE